MAFAGLPHVQSSLGPRFGGISVQPLLDALVGGFKLNMLPVTSTVFDVHPHKQCGIFKGTEKSK